MSSNHEDFMIDIKQHATFRRFSRSSHQNSHRMARLVVFLLTIAIASPGFAQSIEPARKLFEARKPEEAKKLLLAIKEGNKDYAEAQYYLGRIAFDARQYEEALEFFEEAVDENEKVADYQEWMGNAMGNVARDANMFRQGLLAPKMKTAWETAIQLDPKRLGPRFSLIEYYTQAPAVMGGSMEKAEATAREIIRLDPAAGHRALGNVFVKQKKVMEAEKEYLEAVKINPQNTAVLANFYFNQNQHEKAFALFEEALKKNPNDMLAHYQFGKTAALSGKKLNEGEASLKKYLTYQPAQNEPSHAGANMRLAQINEKRGNKAEAKKLYESALRQDANLKEAKEGLERVSK